MPVSQSHTPIAAWDEPVAGSSGIPRCGMKFRLWVQRPGLPGLARREDDPADAALLREPAERGRGRA